MGVRGACTVDVSAAHTHLTHQLTPPCSIRKLGISCGPECQYVGLTVRKAKKRWGEHKASAKPLLQALKPVGKHFTLKGHEVHDMSFVVIEHIRNKNPFFLKKIV